MILLNWKEKYNYASPNTFIPPFALAVIMSITAAQSQEGPYVVMVNKEGMHAIWATKNELPGGWKKAKFKGSMDECTKYIKEVWTDMRPLSVQKKYKEKQKAGYVVIINHEE